LVEHTTENRGVGSSILPLAINPANRHFLSLLLQQTHHESESWSRQFDSVLATSERASAALPGLRGHSLRSGTKVLIAEVPVGNWYERGVKIVPEGVGK
jgi:hypothetical protein